MESQSSMKCLNGCGFFGSSNYEGMCSKCFKEKVKRQMSTTSSASVISHSSNEINTLENQLASLVVNEPSTSQASASLCPKVNNDSTTQSEDCSQDADAEKPRKNRCFSCRKKVGLTGFPCRCGGLFCSLHRYSDTHDCTFDYKESGQEEIRKNNPAIVAAKIGKI